MVDGLLEILQIGCWALVQDHKIHGQALQSPIFEGAKQLAHDVDILDLIDPEQYDRKIAGNALGPERGKIAPTALQRLRWRPQRGVGIDHAIGNALKEMSFLRSRAEMMEMALSLGPGHRIDPIERLRLSMFAGALALLLSLFRHYGSRRKRQLLSAPI